MRPPAITPVRNAIGHLRAAVLGVLSAQAAGQAHEHAAQRGGPAGRRCCQVLDGVAASGEAGLR